MHGRTTFVNLSVSWHWGYLVFQGTSLWHNNTENIVVSFCDPIKHTHTVRDNVTWFKLQMPVIRSGWRPSRTRAVGAGVGGAPESAASCPPGAFILGGKTAPDSTSSACHTSVPGGRWRKLHAPPIPQGDLGLPRETQLGKRHQLMEMVCFFVR